MEINKNTMDKVESLNKITDKEFWTEKITKSIDEVTKINPDYNNKDEVIYDSIPVIVEELAAKELLRISNNSNTMLQTLLISSVVLFLQKLTAEDKIIIGTPIDKQKENLNFINTILPLTFELNSDLSFKEIVLNAKNKINEAIQHQNFPVEALANDLKNKYKSGTPLFDIAVLLNNIQDIDYLGKYKPNLIFVFERDGDKIRGYLKFNSNSYKKETVNYLIDLYYKLLSRSVFNNSESIKELQLLNDQEENQIIEVLKGEKRDYPLEKNIISLFRDQVRHYPDKVAISFQDTHFTYSEIEHNSNQIANMVSKHNVEEESVVAIYLNRSADVVIAMLGVLKANCAYLPLEVGTPLSRIDYILKNSNTRLIISERQLHEEKTEHDEEIFGNKLIYIDDISEYNPEFQMKKAGSESLAYIIYTSGSTGTPKGVKINHKNIINLVYGLNEIIDNKPGDYMHYGLISPFIFDACVQLVYGSLLFGHKLQILGDEERNEGQKILKCFEDYQINILDGTPTHLEILLQTDYLSEANLKLKKWILGGDVLNKNKVETFYKRLKKELPSIINVYGPTECTVNSTYYEFTNEQLNTLGEKIPIGKPFQNYETYILNKNEELCPYGILGELCISGEGITSGYINNDKLTEERIIKNHKTIKKAFYKTGDIVKLNKDGNIIFIGRKDEQVKIRGYRIETAEIDRNLNTHDKIKQVVTIVSTKGNLKSLVTFYVSDQEIESAELRKYLMKNIPVYMIPAYFIQIQEMPLLPNGKINKKLLQDYKITVSQHQEVKGPGNKIEQELLDVWKSNLELDTISTDDNYFNIGGDSIKLLSLLFEINQKLKCNIKVIDLYQNDTIEQLAKLIEEGKQSSEEKDEKITKEFEDIKNNFFEQF